MEWWELIDLNKSVSYSEIATALSAAIGTKEKFILVYNGKAERDDFNDILIVCKVKEIDKGDFPLRLFLQI
jgi:hypothetical protein